MIPFDSVVDPHWFRSRTRIQLFISMWIRIQGAKQCRSMQIRTMIRFLKSQKVEFLLEKYTECR
jgi:hypothetical protein